MADEPDPIVSMTCYYCGAEFDPLKPCVCSFLYGDWKWIVERRPRDDSSAAIQNRKSDD
jgi:hypothetical protein